MHDPELEQRLFGSAEFQMLQKSIDEQLESIVDQLKGIRSALEWIKSCTAIVALAVIVYWCKHEI